MPERPVTIPKSAVTFPERPVTIGRNTHSAITRYGVAIKEIAYGWWPRLLARITGAKRRHDERIAKLKATLVNDCYCYRHHTTYGINGDPSTCPKCGQQELRFHLTGLFD